MLTWIRTQDGTHRGRPCYDYNACGKDGCRYSICWAYDNGGTFGYTAYDPFGKALTTHWGGGICWAGTLSRCKEACNAIENLRPRPVQLPVPVIPGEG